MLFNVSNIYLKADCFCPYVIGIQSSVLYTHSPNKQSSFLFQRKGIYSLTCLYVCVLLCVLESCSAHNFVLHGGT